VVLFLNDVTSVGHGRNFVVARETADRVVKIDDDELSNVVDGDDV
jgi:hypothetical protein